MIRSDFIDYLLLNDTLNVGDYSGRVTSLSVRGLIIRESIPDVSDGELLDSIKRLYDRGTLALEKYDDAIRSYKPYAQYTNDAAFFYAGQFRTRATPEGRRAFDLLRAQIPTPPRQAKRVGF